MSVTRPSTSSNSIRSPILIGWVTAIWTPATMFPIVFWDAKPTIAASTAVEARIPAASRCSSVNWATAIAARTTNTTRTASRRKNRSRVLVERDTCETAGDMEANLPAPVSGSAPPEESGFPYSNWGPWAAVAGVLLALVGVGILSVPVALIDDPGKGEDLGTTASVVLQVFTAAGFLLVPFAIASVTGSDLREAIDRLGIRRFPWKDIGWMAAAIIAYLVFAAVYVAIFGEPEQEDIADGFGALPVQILLIVVAAPI